MPAETFTLFWHGPFSQWHPSVFEVAGARFAYAEQFMMYSKALLFGDRATADKIMQAEGPREQKKLGREASGFDAKTWELFREGVVYTGSYAKFTQNPDLQEALLATRGTTLVEASPYDRVWGIGLGESNPGAHDRSQWQGLNLLCETLTRVREAILWERQRGR